MSFLGDITAGGITGLFKGVGSFAKDVRTAITGEEAMTAEERQGIADKADALIMAVQGLEDRAAAGQIDINKIDAASGSLFKGGWRPMIGWTCAFGLCYTFAIKPLLPWLVNVTCLISGKTIVLPVMPTLNTGELMALTFCLLGFGGQRMYERIKGKA